MMTFHPADEAFESRVRESFGRQMVMQTLGATLERVSPGEIEIHLPYRKELTQQHGFIHAGIIGTILDSACGYAAFSLMPAEAAVLTVEYKVNLLSPALGSSFVARGRVIRAGKTISVCTADAFAIGESGEKLVATMMGTIMAVYNKPGVEQ
jgi:uncharacterized protein (TIGR00369 family)